MNKPKRRKSLSNPKITQRLDMLILTSDGPGLINKIQAILGPADEIRRFDVCRVKVKSDGEAYMY